MADKSLIEWTDATWNIITGCSLVDEGCRHCYAAHLIANWPALGNHPSRQGLARKNAAGEAKFTGEVRFNESWLDQPLRWKKPRKIFVCAHGDLFHENVPYDWIDRVFAVMALCPQHTFQVLTKRPDRARDYLSQMTNRHIGWGSRAMGAYKIYMRAEALASNLGSQHGGIAFAAMLNSNKPQNFHLLPDTWPLPNVWLGTSISDQASADLRIPDLLATPAAIRFVSAEPLLGPVDLTLDGLVCLPCRNVGDGLSMDPTTGAYECCSRCDHTGIGDEWGIDWVICGGESGPKARPMHPDWARSLRDQCAAAGTAFFFKQWGEWGPDTGPGADGRDPIFEAKSQCAVLTDGSWAFFDNGFQPDPEQGDGEWAYRLGKARAGRLLDGLEHSDMPGVR